MAGAQGRLDQDEGPEGIPSGHCKHLRRPPGEGWRSVSGLLHPVGAASHVTAVTGSPRGGGGLLLADFFLLDGKVEQLDVLRGKGPTDPGNL